MLCCVQRGETALFWAADRGDIGVIVQMLVDHGAAVDLGRSEVTDIIMIIRQLVSGVLGVVSLLSTCTVATANLVQYYYHSSYRNLHYFKFVWLKFSFNCQY